MPGVVHGSIASQKFDATKNVQRHLEIIHTTPASPETVRWREPTPKLSTNTGNTVAAKVQLKRQNAQNKTIGDRLYAITKEDRKGRSAEYSPGWRKGLEGAVIDCYEPGPYQELKARLHSSNEDARRTAHDEIHRRNVLVHKYIAEQKPSYPVSRFEKEYQANRKKCKIFEERTHTTALHLDVMKMACKEVQKKATWHNATVRKSREERKAKIETGVKGGLGEAEEELPDELLNAMVNKHQQQYQTVAYGQQDNNKHNNLTVAHSRQQQASRNGRAASSKNAKQKASKLSDEEQLLKMKIASGVKQELAQIKSVKSFIDIKAQQHSHSHRGADSQQPAWNSSTNDHLHDSHNSTSRPTSVYASKIAQQRRAGKRATETSTATATGANGRASMVQPKSKQSDEVQQDIAKAKKSTRPSTAPSKRVSAAESTTVQQHVAQREVRDFDIFGPLSRHEDQTLRRELRASLAMDFEQLAASQQYSAKERTLGSRYRGDGADSGAGHGGRRPFTANAYGTKESVFGIENAQQFLEEFSGSREAASGLLRLSTMRRNVHFNHDVTEHAHNTAVAHSPTQNNPNAASSAVKRKGAGSQRFQRANTGSDATSPVGSGSSSGAMGNRSRGDIIYSPASQQRRLQQQRQFYREHYGDGARYNSLSRSDSSDQGSPPKRNPHGLVIVSDGSHLPDTAAPLPPSTPPASILHALKTGSFDEDSDDMQKIHKKRVMQPKSWMQQGKVVAPTAETETDADAELRRTLTAEELVVAHMQVASGDVTFDAQDQSAATSSHKPSEHQRHDAPSPAQSQRREKKKQPLPMLDGEDSGELDGFDMFKNLLGVSHASSKPSVRFEGNSAPQRTAPEKKNTAGAGGGNDHDMSQVALRDTVQLLSQSLLETDDDEDDEDDDDSTDEGEGREIDGDDKDGVEDVRSDDGSEESFEFLADESPYLQRFRAACSVREPEGYIPSSLISGTELPLQSRTLAVVRSVQRKIIGFDGTVSTVDAEAIAETAAVTTTSAAIDAPQVNNSEQMDHTVSKSAEQMKQYPDFYLMLLDVGYVLPCVDNKTRFSDANSSMNSQKLSERKRYQLRRESLKRLSTRDLPGLTGLNSTVRIEDKIKQSSFDAAKEVLPTTLGVLVELAYMPSADKNNDVSNKSPNGKNKQKSGLVHGDSTYIFYSLQQLSEMAQQAAAASTVGANSSNLEDLSRNLMMMLSFGYDFGVADAKRSSKSATASSQNAVGGTSPTQQQHRLHRASTAKSMTRNIQLNDVEINQQLLGGDTLFSLPSSPSASMKLQSASAKGTSAGSASASQSASGMFGAPSTPFRPKKFPALNRTATVTPSRAIANKDVNGLTGLNALLSCNFNNVDNGNMSASNVVIHPHLSTTLDKRSRRTLTQLLFEAVEVFFDCRSKQVKLRQRPTDSTVPHEYS